MDPPALRLWLPIWCLCRPCWWRCSSVSVFLTDVLITDAGGMMPVFLFVKYVLIAFFVSFMCNFMCEPSYQSLDGAEDGVCWLLVNDLVIFNIFLIGNL